MSSAVLEPRPETSKDPSAAKDSMTSTVAIGPASNINKSKAEKELKVCLQHRLFVETNTREKFLENEELTNCMKVMNNYSTSFLKRMTLV